jgi:hypothetical protein
LKSLDTYFSAYNIEFVLKLLNRVESPQFVTFVVKLDPSLFLIVSEIGILTLKTLLAYKIELILKLLNRSKNHFKWKFGPQNTTELALKLNN